MPTYEYSCSQCGEHVEVVQSFHDDPLTECALCGGELKRVFHPVGIVFKGSGFYVNDSRGGSKSTISSGDPSKSGESAAASTTAREPKDSKDSTTSKAEKPAASSGGASAKSA